MVTKKSLQSDIVRVERGKLFTNSLKFAEEFEQVHRDVLKKINNLTSEYVHTCSWFIKSTFVNDRNREYPYYEITRDGYMFLVMQLGNAKNKAGRDLFVLKQTLFIQAFNKMEQMLLNVESVEWKKAREQGKLTRKDETSVISEFIEYAKGQGSSRAEWYYKNFTSATYKALGLLQHNKPKTREMLDQMELHQLILAESIVTKVIEREMAEGEHYKVIYEKCKHALNDFAKGVNILSDAI